MRLGFLVPIIVIAAGVAGAVALKATRPQPEPLVIQEKVWPVSVMAVQPSLRQPELTLFGLVESPRSAKLTAALTADVVEVFVREGQTAQKGQLLVKLDDRESELLLRQREAEHAEIAAQIEIEDQRNNNDQNALRRELNVLALARRAVKRAQDLARTNVGSKSQLDTARQEEEQRSMAVDARKTTLEGHHSRLAQLTARQAKAEALKDRAKLDVERTKVRAPFAGPVYNVAVAPGDRVQPGTRLVGMYDVEALEFRAQIPSGYLPRVRQAVAAGQTIAASARVDERDIQAELQRLSAEVTRGSGGVDGLFVVRTGGPWLQIGRTVELTINLPVETGAIAIPSQALYGNQHLYRVEDGRMRRISVRRVGEFDTPEGRRVLVRSDELTAGDQIIVTQLPNAVEGLKVRVQS
jgi:RND family efflux transporter MFP subunit